MDDFRAVVNPPETAILAIGVVQIVPRYKDGGFIPRSVAKFVLSVDHRVSDGVEAAQFLHQLKTYLEEPIYLMGRFDLKGAGHVHSKRSIVC